MVKCSSIYVVYVWLCRNGACALCSRGESLSYSGAGLPYDSTEHDPSRSHQDGQGPPRCHPQPWLPPAAQWPRQHPSRQSKDNLKPLVNSELPLPKPIALANVCTCSTIIHTVVLWSVEMPYYIKTSWGVHTALFSVNPDIMFKWPDHWASLTSSLTPPPPIEMFYIVLQTGTEMHWIIDRNLHKIAKILTHMSQKNQYILLNLKRLWLHTFSL